MTDSAGPPPKPEQAATGDEAPVESTAVIPAVSEPETSEKPAPETSRPWSSEEDSRPNGVPEKAVTLRLVRIDPWSVTRMAFVTAVALMIVSVVAAAVLWILLAMGGVFGSINDSMGSVLADDSGSFDVKNYLGFSRMVGGALVLSALNVVFLTVLATIAAHIYNLVAAGLGGVEVTLAEDVD